MKYIARAIHSNLGPGTTVGEIRFENEKLIFASPRGSAELPIAGLKIRVGGHNDEQIFFEHPAQPGWSIYTSESSVLQDPQIRVHRELMEAVKRNQRSRRTWAPLAVLAIVLAGLIAGVILALGFFKDGIVRAVADRIPASWEMSLGDTLFEQIKAQGRLLVDPELNRQLETLTTPLLQVLPSEEYRFQFHILDDTNVNAFAIPGGHVVVHTGLLRAADTSEELAGVLAHEIAHVTEQHGFRKMIESAGLFLVVQALLGDATGIMAVLTESSEFLLRQKFSRDFEREADDAGWNYLLAAQINPRGLIDFFEELKRQHENTPAAGATFLSTHPATQERIDRLEEKWKSLTTKPEFITLPKIQLNPDENHTAK